MKRLKFGIEIEFIGITREAAATIVADFFGTGFFYEGGELKERDIADEKHRIWRVVRDASIEAFAEEEQCGGGRDESERQSAHVSRRGETRHVGHDAASDGEHERGAVRAQLDETPVDGFHGLQGLYAFARTDEHRVVRRQQRMVKAVDRSVGNDDHASLRQHPGEDVGRGTDVNLALFPNVEGGFHDL